MRKKSLSRILAIILCLALLSGQTVYAEGNISASGQSEQVSSSCIDDHTQMTEEADAENEISEPEEVIPGEKTEEPEKVIPNEKAAEQEEVLTDEKAAEQEEVLADEKAAEQEEVLADEKTAEQEEVTPVEETTETETGEKTDLDSYFRIPFPTLKKENRLILPEGMAEVSLSEPRYGNGVLFSGTVEALESGRIGIVQDFCFDRNPVGRISLDGLRDRGLDVKVHVYLDDEAEPSITFSLAGQMGKKEWGNEGEKSFDITGNNLTGNHSVSISFDIEGAESNETAKILVRSIEFAESSLPVMYFHIDESQGTISAMNSSPDHSVECYGSVDLVVPEGFENEYGKAQKNLTGMELEYIRGRGNSTWGEDKKPYKVKFRDKQNFFNMGKNKHWILLANRFDNSFIRNRITYWLGDKFGLEYTPQCQPVEVVMNGTYYGSYLLCEQIRIGKDRVEIDDLEDNQATKEATDEQTISGGYLLSMDNSTEDERRCIMTHRMVPFYLESPSYEDYDNETQRKYITEYLQKTEDAIFGKNFKDTNGISYLDYMDLDAAANYWWIQEFSANGDAFISGSTYLYKKRDSEEGKGKLFWGPLWDFDYVAWGDLVYDDDVPEILDYTSMTWFAKMKEDPVFINKLMERWEVLEGLLDEITKAGGQIDRYSGQTRISAAYDREKWGPYGDNYWDTESKVYSYEEEIEQFRNWIIRRKENVENNLESLKPRMCTVTFIKDHKVLETRTVREGEALEDLPPIPKKAGYAYGGWYSDTWGFINPGDGVYFDMELTIKYLKDSEMVHAKNLYFAQYDVYLEADSEEGFTPVYTICPSDVLLSDVTWTSSDTGVVTVDKNGLVLPTGKLGTATITGRLPSGVKASYKIHIYNAEEETPEDIQYINLNKSSVSVSEDGYTQIRTQTGPNPSAYFGNPVCWMSLDESIATVDECGVVYGQKPGTTTVIAYVTDNINLMKTCRITVTKSAARKAEEARAEKAKKIKAARAKKVKIKAKGLKSHKIRLTWKKKTGVSGYQVYRASKKKGKYKKVATIKKGTKTKWTSGKMKKGKRWYFKVRPYTVIDKKKYYGKWSNIVKKKVP